MAKQISRIFLVILLLMAMITPMAKAQSNVKQPSSIIKLPKNGNKGINFDDLRYFSQLNSVAVPAAQTGDLDLINPKNNNVTVFPSVAEKVAAPGGDDQGATSVAYGNGYLFVGNHARVSVAIVNPKNKQLIKRHKLAGDYDFLRYLRSRHELWVTELGKNQIEILKFSKKPTPKLVHKAFISVPGGPEGLIFDKKRNRVYTNLRSNKTLAISLSGHKIVSRWPNTCHHSRGLAQQGKYLFVGCGEGAAVTLNVNNGKIISKVSTAKGVDLIAYNRRNHHLYIPGARSGKMTVLRVSNNGHLHHNSAYKTARGAHCITKAPDGKVFVCDPQAGNIIVINDQSRGTH